MLMCKYVINFIKSKFYIFQKEHFIVLRVQRYLFFLYVIRIWTALFLKVHSGFGEKGPDPQPLTLI